MLLTSMLCIYWQILLYSFTTHSFQADRVLECCEVNKVSEMCLDLCESTHNTITAFRRESSDDCLDYFDVIQKCYKGKCFYEFCSLTFIPSAF